MFPSRGHALEVRAHKTPNPGNRTSSVTDCGTMLGIDATSKSRERSHERRPVSTVHPLSAGHDLTFERDGDG